MIISKNNKRIANILLATALCFSIIGGIIFYMPVYATNDEYFNVMPLNAISSLDTNTIKDQGYHLGKNGNNALQYYGTDLSDVYLIGVSTGNGYYNIYGVRDASLPLNGSYNSFAAVTNNSYNVVNFTSASVYDGFYYIQGRQTFWNNDSTQALFPYFSSIEDGITALKDYISGSSVISYENYVYIEPGYILFAVTEGGTLDLETTMPVNNSLSIVGVPWDSTSRIAFGVDRPTSGTQYNTDNFGSRIDWKKAPNGNSNFIGLQKEAVAHYEDLPSDGSFVAIMNPAYYGDSVVNPSVNGYIRAKFSNGGAYVKYSMKTNLTLGLGGIMEPVITSDNGWSDGAIAIPTTNGAILDNDYIYENTSKPAVSFDDGGQNSLEDSNDDVQGIGGLLNRIIKFLSSPIEHIQNLFNAGSTFFGFLSSLWSWIPPEISSVLVSAVIVLLVIGVIKVLWK